MRTHFDRPLPLASSQSETTRVVEDVLALREGVDVSCGPDSVTVTTADTTLTLRGAGEGLRASMGRLAQGPAATRELTGGLREQDVARLLAFLNRIERCLHRQIVVGRAPVVVVEHTTRDAGYRPVALAPRTRVRLSRFALCRSRAGELVLESPLVAMRFRLVGRVARELVAALGEATTPADLVVPGLAASELTALLGHLVGAGFVDRQDATGTFGSDGDETLRQWDFHDLLFHSRVRSGRTDEPIGGTFPHRGEIDPQPALKEVPQGPRVVLPRPTFEEITGRDPTLTVAMESRRSVRGYAEQPVTLAQLGEFLYRVARVRVHRHDGGSPGGEILGRPYPTGGSAYELEMYLTVRRCEGLAPGIYYLDTVEHCLVLVNDDRRDREAMSAVAAACTGGEADPDIVITLTSRFQRLSWKYQGMAYATTLRHTGVVYQTMYLVATAMGLAPCGLGIGDADLSARVLGLDYLRESSVGDFLLGSRPPGDLGTWQAAEGWQMVNDPDWAIRSEQSLHPAADRSTGSIPVASNGSSKGIFETQQGTRHEPT